MTFSMSALDSIVSAGSQVKQPKPSQPNQASDPLASFRLPNIEGTLATGWQLGYPKPSQVAQWSGALGDFRMPSPDDPYWGMLPPKDWAEEMQKRLPANVKLQDYLKTKGGMRLGDLDNTGEEVDQEKLKGLYGIVQIGGRIIAEQYNSGMTVTPNFLAGVNMRLSLDAIGPQLAQKRLEEIAEATGGTIVYAKTALNQNQWGELPYEEDGVSSGLTNKQAWLGMIADHLAQKSAGTLFEAQIFGQESDASTDTEKTAA